MSQNNPAQKNEQPKTEAEAQAELKNLQAGYDALQKAIAELEAENAELKDLLGKQTSTELFDALQKDFDNSQAENAKLKKQLANQAAAELKANSKKDLAVPAEIVKHDGKKYRALVSGVARHAGEILTTKEINADPELLAEILAIEGQGIYKEVV